MDHSTITPRGRDAAARGIRRSLLRDAVFDQLLDNVLRGTYRRGQRIPLESLADDMGVSRTPVREALVALEVLQLVSVQRYIGVVIAHWTVEHVTERIRMARTMIAEPPATSSTCRDRFDASWLRGCATEGGAFVELGAWYLRRRGAVVSAEWLLAQRALLDAFYADDVALANGIDAVVGRRDRLAIVERATAAAQRDDLAGCARALDELGAGLIALPERFGVAA